MCWSRCGQRAAWRRKRQKWPHPLRLVRRAPETVGQHRLLQPRTRTLGGTLHDLFTPLYPAMPANNVQPAPLAAAARAAPRFLVLSRLHSLAPGLTPHSAFEKFAAVHMIDVQISTSDGRELLLTRYTQPEPDLKLLLRCLKLDLPEQPPPKISAAQIPSPTPV